MAGRVAAMVDCHQGSSAGILSLFDMPVGTMFNTEALVSFFFIFLLSLCGVDVLVCV